MADDGEQGVAGKEKRHDVFISYAHRDEREFGHAEALAAALAAEGVTVWYDKELMNDAGKHWHPAILRKMETARVIVALWSNAAILRPFCQFEAMYAVGKDSLLPFELEPLRPDDVPEHNENARACLSLIYPLNRVAYGLATAVPQIKAKVNERRAADMHLETEERSATKRLELERKLARATEADARLAEERINLPSVLTSDPGFLVGREKEEALLLDAWRSCAPDAAPGAKTNIVVLHAMGGAGKTALLRQLVEDLAGDGFRHADKALGWSAYSQGSGENRNADSAAFIIEALRFMGELGELPRDAVDRARMLAARMKARRTLLILDGIEPLQSTPEVNGGRLKDEGLQRLILDLSLGHPGLVVITSRQNLPELEKGGEARPGVRSHPLDRLDPKAGAELLDHLGCWGAAKEMEKAVEEAQGHALSVTLLGTYIDAVEGGDIARRDRLGLAGIIDTPEELQATDQTNRLAKRAAAIMRAYIERFEEQERAGSRGAERMLLSIVGLFDRPADGGAVRALLEGDAVPGLTDQLASRPAHERPQRLAAARARLRALKLLSAEDDQDRDALDAHPVVRAHFGKALKTSNDPAYRAAHERLYRHYADAAPALPDTISEMQPLFHAIGHGCAAGLHEEALNDVYNPRVRRGEEHFTFDRLGAFAADLHAVANFFDPPWSRPHASLDDNDQSFVLSMAAYSLRQLGRTAEAAVAIAANLALDKQSKDWSNARRAASNLLELRTVIGDLAGALAAGWESLEHARKCSDPFDRISAQAMLGYVLIQAGRWQEGMKQLVEAERHQTERQPEVPFLYSSRGHHYVGGLLDAGRFEEAKRRAEWVSKFYAALGSKVSLLDRGLALLDEALASATAFSRGDAFFAKTGLQQLDGAIAALRVSGNNEELPNGLLARAAFRRVLCERPPDAALRAGNLAAAKDDLAEVEEIASHAGMKLHLTNWRLESARLCLAQIQGAPPEELVPLREEVEIPARNPGWLARLTGAKPSPARKEWRIVSTGPAPPPPRTARLDAGEKALLIDAEAHTDVADALIRETGYHRRGRELADLRKRLAALRALA